MRRLIQTVASQPTSDGGGVKIQRISDIGLMNPFLMLDEIRTDVPEEYLAGFPSNPHRGFETITYMKAGRMRHQDHMGNVGVIEPGGVQWMSAGRGVIHAEMPEQESGLLHGFQIWLNLPAAEKMRPAQYQDFNPDQLVTSDDGRIRVIAGQVDVQGRRLQGPLAQRSTRPVVCDVELLGGEVIELGFAAEQNALVYVYRGEIEGVNAGQMGVFDRGEWLRLQAALQGAQALVLSGQAIDEPVVQYDPFVMNRAEEIHQAIEDYRSGRLTA